MTKIVKNTIVNFMTATFCLALLSVVTMGQNNKGSIIGTVKDPNGAGIASSKVVVTNNANGETHETTADGGDFAITNLDPGNYKVSVEAAGF